MMGTNNNIEQIIANFHHKITTKVRFHQVDSFKVLHNIQYLYIFETARLEFLHSLGLANDLDDLISKFPVMTVHHSIDYYSPAYFNDVLEVYTKMKEIGNSSIKFENVAISRGKLLASATTVYVYIDPFSGESQAIPQEIKELLFRI